MNISQDFKNAVDENDVMMVRIMLKDSMVVDPTFYEFYEMLSYAEKNIEALYDEHDGEIFSNDLTNWTKDYMDEQMVTVISNFSRERIEFLKKICSHLYNKRAEQIEHQRIQEKGREVHITQKQVGSGLVVAGVATAVAGVIVSKPLIIGAGVVAAVVGTALIVTDK